MRIVKIIKQKYPRQKKKSKECEKEILAEIKKIINSCDDIFTEWHYILGNRIQTHYLSKEELLSKLKEKENG